jgi:rRNA maturation RNase YbeY
MESGISFYKSGVKKHTLEGKTKKYKSWLHQVAISEGFKIFQLNYIFCADEEILEINRKFLQHDYYTDIITFPYQHDKNQLFADIYISLDTVKSNALEYLSPFEEELKRVIVHGLLHLAGYQDKNAKDSAIMRKKENEYIDLFGNEIN